MVKAGDQKIKFKCKGPCKGKYWVLLNGNKITDDRNGPGYSPLALGWEVGMLFVICTFFFLVNYDSVRSCLTWPQVILRAACGTVVKYTTTRDSLEDAWGSELSRLQIPVMPLKLQPG